MRTGRSTLGRRLSAWLITAAAAAGAAVSAMYSAMRGQAHEVCTYKARQTVNAVVSEETAAALAEEDNSFIRIDYKPDGTVGSVSADALKINALENRLRGRINERLSEIEDTNIGVHIGTLTGIDLLCDRGPELRMILQQEAAADIRLTGRLEQAGVNQTRYVLRLETDADILAQLPGCNERVTAHSEYIIAETVIVGDVPAAYYG